MVGEDQKSDGYAALRPDIRQNSKSVTQEDILKNLEHNQNVLRNSFESYGERAEEILSKLADRIEALEEESAAKDRHISELQTSRDADRQKAEAQRLEMVRQSESLRLLESRIQRCKKKKDKMRAPRPSRANITPKTTSIKIIASTNPELIESLPNIKPSLVAKLKLNPAPFRALIACIERKNSTEDCNEKEGCHTEATSTSTLSQQRGCSLNYEAVSKTSKSSLAKEAPEKERQSETNNRQSLLSPSPDLLLPSRSEYVGDHGQQAEYGQSNAAAQKRTSTETSRESRAANKSDVTVALTRPKFSVKIGKPIVQAGDVHRNSSTDGVEQYEWPLISFWRTLLTVNVGYMANVSGLVLRYIPRKAEWRVVSPKHDPGYLVADGVSVVKWSNSDHHKVILKHSFFSCIEDGLEFKYEKDLRHFLELVKSAVGSEEQIKEMQRAEMDDAWKFGSGRQDKTIEQPSKHTRNETKESGANKTTSKLLGSKNDEDRDQDAARQLKRRKAPRTRTGEPPAKKQRLNFNT